MGNYYSGTSANNNMTSNISVNQSHSGTRIPNKRLNNNFLDNLERSNYGNTFLPNKNGDPKKRNSQASGKTFKNTEFME